MAVKRAPFIVYVSDYGTLLVTCNLPQPPIGSEAPTSCDKLTCSFGATCTEVSGQAHCECPPPDCDDRNKTQVGLSETSALTVG